MKCVHMNIEIVPTKHEVEMKTSMRTLNNYYRFTVRGLGWMYIGNC